MFWYLLAIDTAPSSGAGIITAVATLVTAFGGLILAFSVVIPMFKQVKQTHTIVNQQRTNMENFQRALVRALVDAGIEVPIDQSLPTEESSNTQPGLGDPRA